MSSSELKPPPLLEAPEVLTEAFLRQFEYEAPLLKASTWLSKLTLHKIRDVQAVATWYTTGGRGPTPATYISTLFNQDDGRLCQRFNYYCHALLKYRQGGAPQQIVENDLRMVQILVSELAKCTEDAETLNQLKRRINEFAQLALSHDMLLQESYNDRINRLAESIIIIFGRVSDQFVRIEKKLRGEVSAPATAKDVKAIARKTDALLVATSETAKTVKRIDQRGKRHNPRRRFSVELQEACHKYWELGRKLSAVKENTTAKVKYEHVFAYYRKELIALGIKDSEAFEKALNNRSKRISKDQQKHR